MFFYQDKKLEELSIKQEPGDRQQVQVLSGTEQLSWFNIPAHHLALRRLSDEEGDLKDEEESYKQANLERANGEGRECQLK